MGRVIDLTGQRFGKLVVIERVPSRGHARWKCRCDCGNYTEALSNNLKSGNKVSCGCAAHPGSPGKSPSNFNDLTGKKFGRLTVIERATPIGQRVRWLCRCDCGNVKDIAAYELTSGNTKSCGCLQNEARHWRKNPEGRGTRLYGVWKSMRQRCRDKNHKSYSHYGGRGISVCDEWEDYQAFHDWAFSNGYDPDAPRGKCTIDRIDTNGNYEPSNCRWVDSEVQNSNRRPFEHRGGKCRPVVRIDSHGNQVWFPSIKSALEDLGIHRRVTGISMCCRGSQDTALGYRWKYAAELRGLMGGDAE